MSRNTLLKLMTDLSHQIPRLKTILSSRPTEEILERLDGAARIDMTSNVERDGVIAKATVERRLSYLSKDAKSLVIGTLTRSSPGSVMWTKMLAELIEVRGIRALGPMQLFLEAIPRP